MIHPSVWVAVGFSAVGIGTACAFLVAAWQLRGQYERFDNDE